MAKKNKKLSLYKKSLIAYSIFILLAVISIVIYVSLCLKEYDKYDLDNFIKNSIADLSLKDLKDVIDADKLVVSKYDTYSSKKDVLKGIDKALEKKKNITYKLNEESKDDKKPIYDIYYKDKKVFTIKLANKGNIQKIKLLNYTKWEMVDIKSYIEDGLYEVNVTLPDGYKLYVNDKVVEERNDAENSDLSIFNGYAELTKYYKYNVLGLINNPKIKIMDSNNKEVKFENNNGNIKIGETYFKTNNNDEAQSKLIEQFDILNFAEKYSLFLSNDLSGSYHGFSYLKTYLIEGTYMYETAYNWAHGIDITFTSKHRLKNPTFTNESLSNFVIYSDSAFSVDVKFDKNMTVNREDRIVTTNDRLTFVYYNGGWKLLDMKSL